MRDPHKGHAALRRGRASMQGAEYFLTVCTNERKTGLTTPQVVEAILGEVRAMEADETWQMRCLVVMPDHFHLLMVLGERLTLGKSIARLKAKTARAMETEDNELKWERGYFDRRVRADDDRLPLFLYIYLNPYRAELCRRNEQWPWYFCSEKDWNWFKGLLAEDCPWPEWLKQE